MKERFDYLHNKLSHIKRLILEYDSENAAGRMSISNTIDNGIISNSMNNGSNNIGGIDHRHYWHKLKRPPLIPPLFLDTINVAESAFSRHVLRLIFHSPYGSCVLSPESQVTRNGSMQDLVYNICHKASCNDEYTSYAKYSSCKSSTRLRCKSRRSRQFPRRRRSRRLSSSR